MLQTMYALFSPLISRSQQEPYVYIQTLWSLKQSQESNQYEDGTHRLFATRHTHAGQVKTSSPFSNHFSSQQIVVWRDWALSTDPATPEHKLLHNNPFRNPGHYAND